MGSISWAPSTDPVESEPSGGGAPADGSVIAASSSPPEGPGTGTWPWQADRPAAQAAAAAMARILMVAGRMRVSFEHWQ